MAAGSAIAGVIAGTTAGAMLGSSVPVIGTVIGAVAGAGIGWFLSTSTGQKIKGATKEGIKFVIDKAKKSVDRTVGLGKKGLNTVKSWFGK